MKRLLNLLHNEYAFALVSKIILILCSFVFSVLLARYLGPDLQGDYSYVHSLGIVISIVLTFGIHQIYPVLRKKYGKDEILNTYMTFLVVVFIALQAITICIYFFVDFNNLIKTSILIAPIFAYARISSYVYTIERPNRSNFVLLISGILNILGILLFILFLTYQNWIFVYLLVFTSVFESVCSSVLIKFKFLINSSIKLVLVELLKTGIFPMIAILLSNLNYRIDVLMMKEFSNISSADIGIYAVGIGLTEKIIVVPDSFQNILLSHLVKGSDENEVSKVCRSTFVCSLLILLIACVGCYFLISVIYGAEYDYAKYIVLICSVGTIFVGFLKLISQYFIVKRKQYLNAIFLAITLLINIGLNFVFIPWLSLLGAAIATSISHLVIGIIFVIAFKIESKMSFKDILLFKKGDFDFLLKSFKSSKTGEQQ